ncbi:hypothetical protein D3C87_1567240 [compost metagenome]
MALVDVSHGVEDILPTLIHVVLWADANGLDSFLRTDNMLERMSEFLSQLAMGDKHKSDHGSLFSDCTRNSLMVRYRNAAISSTCWGGHLGKEKAKCKPKMPKNQPRCLQL